MIATEKCYQLSQSLFSISTEIPYEDTQFTVNQLIQCATNVLTVKY